MAWQLAVVKECDPNKGSLNLTAKQSVCSDPKHRCTALAAMTESASNDERGIQRFCSHIMEIPTTHKAVLIPNGGTHTSTPIIFHSLSFLSVAVFLSASLTSSCLQVMFFFFF